MRRHTALAALGVGAAILILLPQAILSAGAQSDRASFVLFCVEKGEQMSSIDPIASISSGGTIREPFDGASDREASRFVERWLRPGRAYPVYFGGAPMGSVTVRERPGDPGISLQARVALKTSAPLQNRTMALATSRTPGSAARTLKRRPLSAGERAALLAAALPVFRRNGVSASVAQSVRILNAAALNLQGTGRPQAVARLQAAHGNGPRCDLFVIAEPQGKTGFTLGLTVVNKDKRTATMEDLNYIEQDLVDALDLNRDGIAEVITRSVYYESHDYTIFQKRPNGTWRKIYRGAGGGV